jgi:hypothetical protein
MFLSKRLMGAALDISPCRSGTPAGDSWISPLNFLKGFPYFTTEIQFPKYYKTKQTEALLRLIKRFTFMFGDVQELHGQGTFRTDKRCRGRGIGLAP